MKRMYPTSQIYFYNKHAVLKSFHTVALPLFLLSLQAMTIQSLKSQTKQQQRFIFNFIENESLFRHHPFDFKYRLLIRAKSGSPYRTESNRRLRPLIRQTHLLL